MVRSPACLEALLVHLTLVYKLGLKLTYPYSINNTKFLSDPSISFSTLFRFCCSNFPCSFEVKLKMCASVSPFWLKDITLRHGKDQKVQQSRPWHTATQMPLHVDSQNRYSGSFRTNGLQQGRGEGFTLGEQEAEASIACIGTWEGRQRKQKKKCKK